MSRKHYIEIAQVIRQQIEATDNRIVLAPVRVALREVAESLAYMFKVDNSRFDRSRFMDACGLTSEGN